jgi:hypothetical protein
MASLGKWSGGTVAILPTTSWTAPASLFPTEDRNDGSIYSFAAATSTLTLPSSNLADGYLIVGSYEFEDASNGRHNPQGRFVQVSGTGNFVTAQTSGYNRDNSEDRSYVRTWAFIDSPSASSTIQFQWKRDSDAPTGGTVLSELEVIPLYYSNIGMYSSTSTTQPASNTPTAMTGWSVVTESDTAAIELASDTFTLKSDNKRYIVLGSYYWEGDYTNRTQRLGGLDIDGTYQDHVQAYSYMRQSSDNIIGEFFSWLVDRDTTDIDLQMDMWKGSDTGTFPNYGASVGGTATGSNPVHSFVVLELNDSAEVFTTKNNSQQSLATAGTRVEIDISPSATFGINDTASFTRADDNGVNVEKNADILLGANITGGYESSSGARFTGYTTFTVDGVDQDYTKSGDYSRGNQGSNSVWGWSSNMLSFLEVAAGEDVGVSAGKIAGGEGGSVAVLSQFAGFWGVNLDTLDDVAPPTTRRIFIIS